jgi:hypothetical protein
MTKKFFNKSYLFIIMLLLTSCAMGSVDLSEIDLDAIVYEHDDLSELYNLQDIRGGTPARFEDCPSFQKAIFKQFEINYEGNPIHAGDVSIMLYSSERKLDKAYETILQGMTLDSEQGFELKAINEYGDKAMISKWPSFYDQTSTIFVRCYAIVQIRLLFTEDFDNIIGYAEDLDERLQNLVCP